ncbi:hypothetical protein ACCT09_09855 [Rhizobium ruizarguesonis]
MGLARPQNVIWRACSLSETKSPNGKCLDTKDAFVKSAASWFGVGNGYKIDVTIGVSVREVVIDGLPEHAVYQPVTGAVPLDQLLKVEIDDVSQKPVKQRDAFQYTFGGENYLLAHYEMKGLDFSNDSGFTNFPLHILNLEVLPGTSNIVVDVAVVVRKAT